MAKSLQIILAVAACIVAATAEEADPTPFADYIASHSSDDFDHTEACDTMDQDPGAYFHTENSVDENGVETETYNFACDDEYITVVCDATKCSTPAGTPPADPATQSEESPPPPAYTKDIPWLGTTGMQAEDAKYMLDLVNKMRCATGADAVEWDGDLATQAQSQQDKIGTTEYSSPCAECGSYDLPIPAAETTLDTTDVHDAAFKWWTEFSALTQRPRNDAQVADFVIMVYPGVTKIGCGMQVDPDTGDGFTRCQYAGSALPSDSDVSGVGVPPYGVPSNGAQMTACGLDPSEVSDQIKLFQSWGILNPAAGTYRLFGMFNLPKTMASGMIASGALVGVAFIGITMKMVLRRRAAAASYRTVDAEHGLENTEEAQELMFLQTE